MTLWDCMSGDRENEMREADACQSCGVPLDGGVFEFEGLDLDPRGIGLCQACAEENLPALCSFCGGALGLNGSPEGGDPICDSCLEGYWRRRYSAFLEPMAWETTAENLRRLSDDNAEMCRLRSLADAERDAGGDRAAVHAAEARWGIF